MSRRKENVRKMCEQIRAVAANSGMSNDNWVQIYRITHRIKRTTWRGDENKLDNKITDQIKQISMRIFTNNVSSVNLKNNHPPATDY